MFMRVCGLWDTAHYNTYCNKFLTRYEEVGIQVENIRYYKSQPWGFSGGLLMGFFADAVGDLEIHCQEEELSEALWVKRKDVILDPEEISLTREMMKVFKEKEIK